MEVLYPQCAGLDVHKETVVACARIVRDGSVSLEVKTFATTTSGLCELSQWLSDKGCTHAAMEATGIYWKPVWHILESDVTLILANAQHVRNVPGRKTDVNDAMWLAELLAHGLIRSSFVPPQPIQEMRSMTRTRKQLVHDVSRHTSRIHKTLEDANIKLTSVVSDVLGKTSMAILKALIRGETDPEKLADLAQGSLKKKRAELVEACHGKVTPHHRKLLTLHLRVIDTLRDAIEEVDIELGKSLDPIKAAVELVDTIPGLNAVGANNVIAEIGIDMTRFPSAGHLLSWATLCPRNDESAGKRRSTRIRKGSPWLKTTLITAAWAAVKRKDTYFRAQFLRLKSRRGPKKAIVAVAASMLTAIYHMLRTGAVYQDLGPNHFDQHDRTKTAKRLIRRLHDLGFKVEFAA